MATVDDYRVKRAEAALNAVKIVGEDLLGESSRRAPIAEGTLRGSAQLSFRINGVDYAGAGAFAKARVAVRRHAKARTLRTIEAVVTFTEVYAARQHEETTWTHPLGGQAKYLESVVLERNGRYERVISAAMERV